MGSDLSCLLDKFRHGLRNQAVTQFTVEQLRRMADLGVLHLLAKAEADEIAAAHAPAPARSCNEQAEPNVYSVRTLARRWSCSEGLVRIMIKRGELKAFRYGNLIRITPAAVAEVEKVRD